MKTAAELTPFVRYLLLFLAGMVQQGGMIPPDLAKAMAHDPAVVDLVASLLIAGGALAWYLWSTSRKALASLFR